jgi:DNA-binding transcriptional LysR family regulator
MFDWNDLRHFLAVAKAGTTLAAARELGVSQSTAARRIDALETALGVKLFDRRQSGYALTDLGKELAETATGVEVAAGAFASRAAALRRGLTGTVRITTNDLFAGEVLMPSLNAFRRAHPRILLEMVTSDRRLDLAKGEADVALRAGTPPSQANLVGRRIAKDTWSFYCSRAYAKRHGKPASLGELANHQVLGPDPQAFATPLVDWLQRSIPRRTILLRQNNVGTMLASLRNGLGVGLMADFVARSDPELVLCFEPGIDVKYEIWLLTHERLRNDPHVRAVLNFLDRHLRSERRRPGTIDRPRRAASAPRPRRK